MDRIAQTLKEIIDRKGLNILTDSPYEVYKELLSETDKKTAVLVFHTLLMDIPDLVKNKKIIGKEELSKLIQKECFIKKGVSDSLSDMYLSLYSNDNQGSWNNRKLHGLKSFLNQEWEVEWNGSAEWDGGQVYVACDYHATIVIASDEGNLKDSKLDQMLLKNPFLEDEAIADYFQESLFDYLDGEFEEYCTCDDYYPPVGEDFEAESYTEEWCKEHGFELVSFDGEGSTGDYEPKSSRW